MRPLILRGNVTQINKQQRYAHYQFNRKEKKVANEQEISLFERKRK